MKRFLAMAIVSLFSLTAIAESQIKPAITAPLADKSLLLDIAVTSSGKLVVVGEHGNILHSSNGQTWEQANVPVQSTLTAVTFVNPSLGWAVGHDATILATTDGGYSWKVQQHMPELEKPLLDIVFKNDKQGIAVGAYGLFFVTNDGGNTWTDVFQEELLYIEDLEYLNELKLEDEEAYLDERSSILPHFNRIYLDGRTMYLAGEIGLLAKSNDFGDTWQRLDEIYEGSFLI